MLGSFVYYVGLCIVVDDMKKNINNNIIEDKAGPRRTRGASERAQTDEDDATTMVDGDGE